MGHQSHRKSSRCSDRQEAAMGNGRDRELVATEGERTADLMIKEENSPHTEAIT